MCKERAETLEKIFQALAKDAQVQSASGKWEHLKRGYKTIVLRLKQYNKADTVEELMQQLLDAVQNLANYQIFRSAAEGASLLQKINDAVDNLAKIQDENPTLTEEELNEAVAELSGPGNSQNNYGSGQGVQNNARDYTTFTTIAGDSIQSQIVHRGTSGSSS